jgi:hypothetical protein
MSSIYAGATRVPVWLGLSADNSNLAMKVVGNAASRAKADRRLNIFERQAIHNLFREYWHRILIVQEFALSQHVRVHCGRKFVEIEDIEYMVPERHNWISKHEDDWTEKIAFKVFLAWQWRREDTQPRTLGDLVSDFKWSYCSDPRDKVYALLGLAGDIGSEDFPVDYSKSFFSVICEVLKRTPDGMKLWRLTELLKMILQDSEKTYPKYRQLLMVDTHRRFSDFSMGHKISSLVRIFDDVFDGWSFKPGQYFEHFANIFAYESLAKLIGEPSDYLYIFNWLESVDNTKYPLFCCHRKSTSFLRWPLRFPVELRQLIKLILFLNALKYNFRRRPSLDKNLPDIRVRDGDIVLKIQDYDAAEVVINGNAGAYYMIEKRTQPRGKPHDRCDSHDLDCVG